MKRRLLLYLATAFLIFFIPGFASATIVVNSLDGSMQWLNTSLAGGNAEIVDLTGIGGNLENNNPLPTGALKVTTGFSNDDKGEIGMNGDFGLASGVLNDIILGYDYYKQDVSGGNIFAAPSIKLTLFTQGGTGDNWGTLVYEPTWNQAGTTGSTAPPTNEWQTVDINSTTGTGVDAYGGWWWTGGFGEGNGAGGPPLRSLSEWVTAFSASDPTDFSNAHVVGINIGVGRYNQGQIGYFDNVSIQTSSGQINVTYDFEVGAAVPEPTTMILFGLGLLSFAGVSRKKQ